jgi:hypothetical protein
MTWLFLDIDGVLNHQEWYESIRGKMNSMSYVATQFDPLCVERINRIVKETNANLVISSSWRSDDKLLEIFSEVGLPKPKYRTLSQTQSHQLGYTTRGEEIEFFLKHMDNNHLMFSKNYAIIDDDNDFTNFQKENCLFRTAASPCDGPYELNGGTGLTEILTEKIIKHLKNNG